MKIPFNKPYFTGREAFHLSQAAITGKLSGNGNYTRDCQLFFEKKYGFKKTLLTTSCSDALEMAALLLEIKPGDEVIIPSYTFVSTANAFALRGATIVFADSGTLNPNMDASLIEALITPKTRAIVVVHYGGIACDMDKITEIAGRYNIAIVEDAAQGVDAYYRDQPLGSIGKLGTFSFHETKNITSGEGGMLIVNDHALIGKAEIIWEKGTNRAAFARGEVEKYEWVGLGSSFLPNELTAAFLYSQLEHLDVIQQKRLQIWQEYHSRLSDLAEEGLLSLPHVPEYARHNGHLFYITTRNSGERDRLLAYLLNNGIHAVFHYLTLHNSPYYKNLHDGRHLSEADRFASTLLRLPFYYSLDTIEIEYIYDTIRRFYKQ
ncbi:MAG: dTDP-4-amino-4,6-dideoxygalactose transaminase [Bacteroidales bacterium]|nr:dTDP-4-amino-4,6-dideoxygalactose transaminase [Bacteroidales bacterium]